MEPAKFDPATGQPVPLSQEIPQIYGQPVPQQQIYGQPVPQQQYVPQQYGQPVQAQYAVPAQGYVAQVQAPKLEYPFSGSTAIERWGKGVCDCTDDCGGCLLAFFCPCIVYGQNMENALGMQSSCTTNGLIYVAACCLPGLIGCPGVCCFVTCAGRKQIDSVLSSKSNGQTIPENDINACCCHLWCESCSLGQEKRAVDNWRKAGGKPGQF